MKQPTDREIIRRAMEALAAGILPSNLPNRLMDEFNLSPEKARELAGVAMKRHKQLKVKADE